MSILILFIFMTVVVIALTLWMTRSKDSSTSEGYFLVGRSLTAFPIAMVSSDDKS